MLHVIHRALVALAVFGSVLTVLALTMGQAPAKELVIRRDLGACT